MPRRIALDTEAVIAEGFDFSGPTFSALRQQGRDGEVELLLVDVTDREIRTHIAEDARAAVKLLERAYLLRVAGLFDYVGAKNAVSGFAAEQAIERHWDELLADMSTERLSVAVVNPATVFDAYFSVNAPFGPGKKRKEFPDAFVIERLRMWATEKESVVHVVSDDGDWAKACDGKQLIYWKTVGDFLADLIKEQRKEQEEEELREAATEFLENQTSELHGELTERFRDLSVMVEDDLEADGEEFGDVNVEIEDVEVIDQRDDRLQLEGLAWVSYEVHAMIADYDNSPYAEGEYVFMETEDVTFRRKRDELRFSVVVQLGGDPPRPTAYSDLAIIEPAEIRVSVGSDEYVVRRASRDEDDGE